MNTYFGQQQGLTHQQLAEAARAMNLPTNRETLRRVIRANSILCRGLVKSTSLDCLFKVKSQLHKDKEYMVMEREGSYICCCRDYAKRLRPCKHAISVMAYHTLVELSAQSEVVEAYDEQHNYYRFVRMCPPTTNLPTLEVEDEI